MVFIVSLSVTKTYRADVIWLGTHGNYNPEFQLGQWSFNGFFMSNLGEVKTETNGDYKKAADIFGYAANLRAGYKFGQTADDNITIDLFFASGDDDNLDDKKYNGVLTGNNWGLPGGIMVSHGAYLLYPHGNVVNRYVAAINDLSNIGLGQIGGTLNFSKSLIPNKAFAKVGVAAAQSMVEPNGGGKMIGTEVNAMINYKPAVYMDIELHGAYLWLGDFYESKSVNGGMDVKPDNPFTVFVVFKWLMF
ncbi:MAG: hypothetical protein U5K00_12395 [Melioribacteraceae bacterium]|nr:hypothetical protein [Melioribacteraceae bacterium]